MPNALRTLTISALLSLWASLSLASPLTNAVLDAMRLGELMEILQRESELSGQELDDSMLDGTGGAAWARTVSRINDAERLEQALRAEMAQSLDDSAAEQSLEFLSSEQGQRIVGLELSAREALLDPAIEEMNMAAMEAQRGENTARFAQVTRFVEVNDLINANVAGALTGNVAFLRGLRDGGFPPYERVGDSQLLADVWQREPEIRLEAEEWVYSFLTLAFGPLGEADLEAYTAFSETEAGKALNRALFLSFDQVFGETSHALGEAVAQFLMAEDI
ncbi:MAG: hypothetical protein OIF40_16310 [Mangrovicoccus sp.]|nr:hypothetical protein [Mangrovicoccus sp.]